MPKRLRLEEHLSTEELEARYRKARDPVLRSHYQIVWLLSLGKLTREVREVIRNPVVNCAYAKETRVVALCEHRRAGAPLQEGQRSRGTLSSADRMAAQRGQDHRGGVQGDRLQPWLGTPDSPPLQRAGRRGPR